nr:uncharacterized protein LOC109735942 [Aegilops tauschii subsp. strangulata]
MTPRWPRPCWSHAPRRVLLTPPPPLQRAAARPAGRPGSRRRREPWPHDVLMAGIVNKEFPELAQTGLNYLSWSSDCEIFLQGKTLLRAIDEYMAERSASGLWTALKQRFERLKYTVKPRAEAEWIRLRFADFKTKIEKTLSTFHPDAVQSSRNYRQGNYTRYSELSDVLQVAEAQDEVLKKNFGAQPLGGSSRQEVNALEVHKRQQKKRGQKGKKKGPHPPSG